MKKLITTLILLSSLTALCSCASSTSGSTKITCGSCGEKVSSLIKKKDMAGVTRKWCPDCWNDYNEILGR